MLPLNNEWLSWPPESLDGFFNSDTTNEVDLSADIKHLFDQPTQEKGHEIQRPNRFD